MLNMRNLGIVYRNFDAIQRSAEHGMPWAKVSARLSKDQNTIIDESSLVECYEFVKAAEERSRRVRQEYGGYDCL